MGACLLKRILLEQETYKVEAAAEKSHSPNRDTVDLDASLEVSVDYGLETPKAAAAARS